MKISKSSIDSRRARCYGIGSFDHFLQISYKWTYFILIRLPYTSKQWEIRKFERSQQIIENETTISSYKTKMAASSRHSRPNWIQFELWSISYYKIIEKYLKGLDSETSLCNISKNLESYSTNFNHTSNLPQYSTTEDELWITRQDPRRKKCGKFN